MFRKRENYDHEETVIQMVYICAKKKNALKAESAFNNKMPDHERY